MQSVMVANKYKDGARMEEMHCAELLWVDVIDGRVKSAFIQKHRPMSSESLAEVVARLVRLAALGRRADPHLHPIAQHPRDAFTRGTRHGLDAQHNRAVL